MGNRRWIWIGACLVAGGLIFWGVGLAVNPSSGDTELRKTLEAMKQVKSFRGTFVESTSSTQHSERLWEVDCNRVIVHQQSHVAQTNTDAAFETTEEELSVGEERYTRDSNGSWENAGKLLGDQYSAQWYCDSLARAGLLPDIPAMLSHAVSEKGDKKTVNGVRCREWKLAIVTPLSTRHGSICIGLEDHLPYEMTKDGGRYSYSDYNRPIQFEAPEAVVQPASSPDGTN